LSGAAAILPVELTAILYVAGVLTVAFVLSGVVSRYRTIRARRLRVEKFRDNYSEWVGHAEQIIDGEDFIGAVIPRDASAASELAAQEAEKLRPWLVARRDEMQRDAQVLGHGVVTIQPPPMVGGPIRHHGVYADLFDEQSYAADVVGASFRKDDLATIIHEAHRCEDRTRRDLYNPLQWVRLAFERIVGFPRYALRVAGFGENVTESTGVRVASAIWSIAVGVATIGAFVVSLINS
jgi:hypothetical protein